MSFTYADVISNARTLVADTGAARWTPDEMLVLARAAVDYVAEQEPEAMQDDRGDFQAQNPAAAATDPLPIAEMYRRPLVDFICMQAFASDSADKRDEARSQMFRRSLVDFFTPKR